MPHAPTRAGSLHRGLVADDAVRFLAVEARAIAEHTREIHELEGPAARLAAQAIVATLLMSAWLKGTERITLQIQGQRPRLAFVADADVNGGVRARFTPAHLRQLDGDRLSGLMLAIKANDRKELYRGVTEVDQQTIAEGLMTHLTSSDQVDIILRIDATVDATGAVTSAGGLLLERLPTDPTRPSLTTDEFAAAFSTITEQPVADLLIALAFGKITDRPIRLLENREVHWRCGCSQQAVETTLASLGPAELHAMADEDDGAEVVCHFCNIAYRVGADRLRELAGSSET